MGDYLYTCLLKVIDMGASLGILLSETLIISLIPPLVSYY